MGISKIAAIASARLDGFDSTMEKLGKFRDKILGWGSAIRKAYTGSSASIQTRGSDPFIQANQDRLHKLEQVRKGMSSVTGAAKAAVVGIAAIGAMFGVDKIVSGLVDVTEAIFDVDRQARHMGEQTDWLMGFQYATKRTGEDVQETANALANLYDNFQAAGNGGILAAKKFDDASISLKGWRKIVNGESVAITPLDIFAESIRSLAKIKDDTERIGKARLLFGADTASIIPMLEKHRKGFDIGKQMQEPIKMGSAITGGEVAALRETANKFEDAALIIKGAYTQFAIAAAPFAKMFTTWITNHRLDNDGTGLDFAARVLTFAEKMHDWFLDFMAGLSLIVNDLTGPFLVGFAKTTKELVNAFNKQSPIIKIETSEIDKIIADGYIRENARKKIKQDLVEQKYNSSYDNNLRFLLANAGFDKVGEWLSPARKQQAELARNKPLYEAADQLLPSLLTPFEKYTESIAKLGKMQDIHAFGDGDIRYGQALNQQLLSLESALQLMNVQLPTISRMNTGQAESSVAKSRLEYDLKSVDTPQKRLERLQTQGNEIQARIESAVKDLAKAQGQRRPLILNGGK